MTAKRIKRLKSKIKNTSDHLNCEELQQSLIRRGLETVSYDPQDKLIVPGKNEVDKFYSLLRKYSFRLFLRDIIQRRERFIKSDLTKYCNSHTAQEYIDFLLKAGIITNITKKSYKLIHENIDSFGETLEWYLAEILRREFYTPSLRSVKFHGLAHGGDYDIIAKFEEKLLFIEVKSSPPRHIHQDVVKEFFNRLEDMNPDLAIFFTDTHLRLEDKINKMIRIEMKERNIKAKITGEENRIFDINKKLFIMRSKPDITGNLKLVARDFFKYNRRFWE